MTQPMTAPATVQAADCWTSFTSMCSSALRALATGVQKLWNTIKTAANYIYAAAVPLVNRAVQWMKANQQTAAIGAIIGTVATAVGIYFCCCKNTDPVAQVPAQEPVSTKV